MAMGGKKNKSTRGQPLPSSSSLPPPLSPPPPPLPHYKIRAVIVALLRGERGENHSDNMLECSSGQIWWHCGCARVGSDIYNRPPAPASPAVGIPTYSETILSSVANSQNASGVTILLATFCSRPRARLASPLSGRRGTFWLPRRTGCSSDPATSW